MGKADMILGIKIIRDGSRIKQSQAHYIEKVIKRYSMLDMTPVSHPMEPGMKFSKHTRQPISNLEYSKVIGSLMYAMTCARPNKAFAVGKLNRFTSNTSAHH